MARGLLIWLLIMVAETVHGVLRGLLVVPRIGASAAERIGWPVGALLVLAIAVLGIRWIGIDTRRGLLGLGAAWAVLTACYEIAIALLRGLNAAAVVDALNPLSGSVAWSAALMLLAPLVAARLRGLA